MVLLVSILPGFGDPSAPWPFAVQIAELGRLRVASCAVVHTAVGLTAPRVLRALPAAAPWVTRLAGAVMIAIGALLLVEQLTR